MMSAWMMSAWMHVLIIYTLCLDSWKGGGGSEDQIWAPQVPLKRKTFGEGMGPRLSVSTVSKLRPAQKLGVK